MPIPDDEDLEGMPQQGLYGIALTLPKESDEFKRVWGFMTDHWRKEYRKATSG